MSAINSNRAESMVDLVIRSYGHIEGIIDFCRDNGTSVDAVETASVERLVNDVRKQELRNERAMMPVKFTPSKAEIVSNRGQNNIDLALQEYGSVEGLIPFLRSNGIGVNDLVPAGTVLKALTDEVVNADIKDFYRSNNYTVNTDKNEVEVVVPTGIGSMIIETNFIVG